MNAWTVFASTCRLYRAISDISTYQYKFVIWRHWESVAIEIMQFCSINLQIGHYKTYAAMIKNEFSKNC